jgi:hypothetical protein
VCLGYGCQRCIGKAIVGALSARLAVREDGRRKSHSHGESSRSYPYFLALSHSSRPKMSRDDTGAFRCSDIDRNLLVATTHLMGVTLEPMRKRGKRKRLGLLS